MLTAVCISGTTYYSDYNMTTITTTITITNTTTTTTTTTITKKV